MKPTVFCAFLAVCCATLAQPATPKLAFEVASIKPSEPSPNGMLRIGMSADNAGIRYSNVSLKDCMRIAYSVKDFQIEGPEWIDNQRFDIVAKLPGGGTQEQIPEMLQSLLADRFKLTFHRDTKEHAIYALIVGKNGPKLKPAEVSTGDAGANPERGGIPRGGMSVQVDGAGAHLTAPSATLSRLAEMISRFSERPIVDMTGIDGQYDFELVFSPENLRGARGPGGGAMSAAPGGHAPPTAESSEPGPGSIYDSVQRFGLKLDPRKAPMEVLLVDHIEKAATEN
jgi:uncharacterized protein (TIGR03435 family)